MRIEPQAQFSYSLYFVLDRYFITGTIDDTQRIVHSDDPLFSADARVIMIID
jgi:hypothetical protein